MTTHETTCPHPGSPIACARRRMRQRNRDHDAANAHDDDLQHGEGHAGTSRPFGSHWQPSSFHLRALEQPDPTLGKAVDSRTRPRRTGGGSYRPKKEGYPRPPDDRPVSDHVDPPRSVLPRSDRDCKRTATRSAVSPRWNACRSHRGTERNRKHWTSTSAWHDTICRLECEALGLRHTALGLLVAICASLTLAPSAAGDTRQPDNQSPPQLQLGYYSQQIDRGRARIGVSVAVESDARTGGRGSGTSPVSDGVQLPTEDPVDHLPEPFPALRLTSTLARNPTPAGPGSFWYPIEPGRVCIYLPGGAAPCYTLVGSGGTPTRAGIDPVAIAASVASRLPLVPGRIRTSPRSLGLTGTNSWFWLEPSPIVRELTVSLAGETVAVRAEPRAVEWRFGDGAEMTGGRGRPYQSGPVPPGAVVHLFETRCLLGDRGRNPYLLGTCGSAGYAVEAVVIWRISYSARGPVEASGALPTRTTATSIVYPVSEARAFLVAGGAP